MRAAILLLLAGCTQPATECHVVTRESAGMGLQNTLQPACEVGKVCVAIGIPHFADTPDPVCHAPVYDSATGWTAHQYGCGSGPLISTIATLTLKDGTVCRYDADALRCKRVAL